MAKTIEIRDKTLFMDSVNFAIDIINACEIQSNKELKTRWANFNPRQIDRDISDKIKEIVEYIVNLRKQRRDDDAVYFSDAFFQSFTGLMNIFVGQKNFSQVINMWNWAISKVGDIEEEQGIEFGKGVHKGTAFYFLGFSQLMTNDIDGGYLSFAEAAKEDEILPQSVLRTHLKGIPPAVKILLFDLSEDNFAYGIVKQIRSTIDTWERQYPNISRNASIFVSIENAMNKDMIPAEISIHLNYAFTKAVILDLRRKELVRPTFLTITQLGESILRFARTLEDFVRSTKGFTNYQGSMGARTKIFDYCHRAWFSSENWDGVSSYYNDIETLINDFINDKWKLSKDGRNLLFSLKIRNVLAHRIPNNPKLYENYIEIILAISSSFGFICDELIK